MRQGSDHAVGAGRFGGGVHGCVAFGAGLAEGDVLAGGQRV
ncbi:hypothetical protein ACFRU3_40025 [Streptomyces sp. NPDC056910]